MVMGQKQRHAIGGCRLERLGCQLATGTCLVLHHHRHAELVFELVGQGAGNGVGSAAGGETYHQLDRARLGLRQATGQQGTHHRRVAQYTPNFLHRKLHCNHS